MKLEVHNNTVLRDGLSIGAIHEGTCYSAEAIAGPTKGKIRLLPGLQDLKFAVGPVPDIAPGAEQHGQPESTHAPASAARGGSTLSSISDDDLAAELKRRGLIQDAPAGGADITPSVASVDAQGQDIDTQIRTRDQVGVERLLGLAEVGRIPRPPARNSMLGDKDPAFVAWFREHATDAEFNEKYPPSRTIPRSTEAFAKAEKARHARLAGEVDDDG